MTHLQQQNEKQFNCYFELSRFAKYVS